MKELRIIKVAKHKKILEFLEKNINFKKVEEVLGKALGSFELFLLDKKTAVNEIKLKNKNRGTKHVNRSSEELCLKTLREITSKVKKTKKSESFECPVERFGFCCPLLDENEVFGYVIGCNFKKRPHESIVEFFGYFVDTVLNSVKKETQLEELYKSVEPRQVALSTVHTIHRLITSTLYLDELLPRIARLSMQIIKAQRCSIKLVDSKRKTLLPKATVDLRTKKTRLKKVKIGRWAPGKAVKYGKSIRAKEYLATPLIDEDVIGVITLYDKADGEPFNNFDVEIMRTLAEQAAIAIKNAQLYREQERLTMGSIKALAQILESRSAGICVPKSSFLKIVRLIGQEFELSEHELKMLQYAALLHDTGELMLPDNLIRKKGKLTEKEYKMIKEHPLKGAKVLKSLKSLKAIAPIIMHHHENFNGTGYPKGLKGSEIPLGSRILGVVGAFEAMITKRPYRVSRSIVKAIDEINENSKKQFDPKIVEVFLSVVKRKDIRNLLKKEI